MTPDADAGKALRGRDDTGRGYTLLGSTIIIVKKANNAPGLVTVNVFQKN